MAEVEKKVQALEIDRFLQKDTFNRVSHVGVELEGGWMPKKGLLVQRDASVFKKKPSDVEGTPPAPGVRIGEVVSDVMLPAQLEAWVKKYYPEYTDHTCGMHLHMSFPKVYHYEWLMVPEYPATVREYLRRWAEEQKLVAEHPLWERLEGKNEYCRQTFWPDKQASTRRKDYDHNRDGHRYTDINYCFGRNGTLECRLLPMMATAEQALSALRKLIDVTNASLVVLAKPEKRIVHAIEKPSQDEIVDFSREVVF